MYDIVNQDTRLDRQARSAISSNAMKPPGPRIAEARKRAELTQEALADAVNVGQSTIAGYERGVAEPDLATFVRIATATDSDAAWLAFGRAQSSAVVEGSKYLLVPNRDLEASAGPGLVASDDDPESFTLFESGWLRGITKTPPALLSVIRVRGDSMEPALRNGDQLLIDHERRQPARDGIYVISLEGILQVKRVSMHPKTKVLTVSADNPAYPTYSDLKPKDLNIVGQVVWIGRPLI